MQSDPTADPGTLTPAQHSFRAEWRNLCFTVERYQADDLLSNCRDKYQFAKTYMNYGRGMDRKVADLEDCAKRGIYTFFTERGIPTDVMSPTLVQRLLGDWKGAIASKRTRVAEAFEIRFGEEIGVFIATAHNADRLTEAESLDEADALILLSKWARDETR